MGHKKERKVYTQHSRIHYHLHEGDYRCKYRAKGIKILHKWSRGWNMTIPKSMSMVKGCDAPKFDTEVRTRTKDWSQDTRHVENKRIRTQERINILT